jgi:hypothetical protein
MYAFAHFIQKKRRPAQYMLTLKASIALVAELVAT